MSNPQNNGENEEEEKNEEEETDEEENETEGGVGGDNPPKEGGVGDGIPQGGVGDSIPQEKKTSNCPPDKTCVVRDLAKNVNSFGDAAGAIGTAIEASIKKKAASAASSVKTLFNPAKCAASAVVAVPQMFEGIFNSVANGMDRVAKSAENMSVKIANLAVDDDGLPNILAPFKIVVLSTMKKIQSMFGSMVFGSDKWAKILADPNMNSEKIVDDMAKASEAFSRIVDSPAFKKIFNKWLMGYAAAMDKVIQMGKPKIDGVTNKLTGMIDDTSKKIGKAFTDSLANVIGAALKSIPGVGIIFNAADLAHKMATKIVSVCEPPISKGGVSLITIANAGLDQVKNAQCKGEELINKLSAIMPGSGKQSGGGGVQSGGGGRYRIKLTHNNRKKIIRATKRVKFMLGKFTKKYGAHLNYAAKLKTRRRLHD